MPVLLEIHCHEPHYVYTVSLIVFETRRSSSKSTINEDELEIYLGHNIDAC